VLYLLDANVLIDADRDYYPLDDVPEFWEWVIYRGQQNHMKMCAEVYDEITKGTGKLVTWLKQKDAKNALLLIEDSNPATVNRVVVEGYAPDLTDIEIEKLGCDPFLIAHALKDSMNRFVVSAETSAPSRTRHNRKVPDVCADFKIRCRTKFELTKDLQFSTNWKRT